MSTGYWLHCKTCDKTFTEGEETQPGRLATAWRFRSRLIALYQAVYREQGEFPHLAFFERHHDLYGMVEPMKFFVEHDDHDVGVRDEYGNELPILRPLKQPDPAGTIASLAADERQADIVAVQKLLTTMCERAVRGTIRGVVLIAHTSETPAGYEMRWAGWNDAVSATGAMEAAKYAMLRNRLEDGSFGCSGTSEAAAQKDNVVDLKPDKREADVLAVRVLLFDLAERASKGQIRGVLLAVQSGGSNYEVKWEGWRDVITAAGAIDAAQFALLRNYIGGGK